jgi:hypothetical protein
VPSLVGKAISSFAPQGDPRHIPEHIDGARQSSVVTPPEYPPHFLQRRYAQKRLLGQMETVEPVKHRHIKGCRGGAFFHKAANMKILMVVTQVSETVNQT